MKAPMGGIGMMLKTMGLDPEHITNSIAEMGQAVVKMNSQADRIETNQILIMEKLGITPASNEKENANG